MVSKHSELVKRQAQDLYERFTSPSSRTAPPPSRQEVRSSNRRRTTHPPSRQEVESYSRRTAPPPSCQEEHYNKIGFYCWLITSFWCRLEEPIQFV
jgi:hypothetical protein